MERDGVSVSYYPFFFLARGVVLLGGFFVCMGICELCIARSETQRSFKKQIYSRIGRIKFALLMIAVNAVDDEILRSDIDFILY